MLGTGKLLRKHDLANKEFEGFRRHTEWAGTSLIIKKYQLPSNKDIWNAIYRKITVTPTMVIMHKEFNIPYVNGSKVYLSTDDKLMVQFFGDEFSISVVY